MLIIFPDTVIVIILINRIYKKLCDMSDCLQCSTTDKKKKKKHTLWTVNVDAMGEDLNGVL